MFDAGFDIAYNSGGSEAIAESLYSCMKNQRTSPSQTTETLEKRTKIDWTWPTSAGSIGQSIDKCVLRHIASHKRGPTLAYSDPRTTRKVSKVVERLNKPDPTSIFH